MMDFQPLLRFAVEHDASDVHIQSGLPPSVRIGGIIRLTDQPAVTEESARNFISSIAPERFKDKFDERLFAGMDFSYALPGMSRFRCSAYQQLGAPGVVMRIIKGRIPSIADLHLPSVVGDVAL